MFFLHRQVPGLVEKRALSNSFGVPKPGQMRVFRRNIAHNKKIRPQTTTPQNITKRHFGTVFIMGGQMRREDFRHYKEAPQPVEGNYDEF